MDHNTSSIGPDLPPNYSNTAYNDDSESSSEMDNQIIGPALPPAGADLNIPTEETNDTSDDDDEFGPALPPGFEATSSKEDHYDSNDTDNDDDDVIGPVPAGQEDKNHQYDASKRKFKKEQEITKREKWMLEPGKALAKTLQTKSVTKFSQKSSKKDAPLTKEQKLEQESILEREGKMRDFLDKYEKSNKRDISLLDQHRKDLNKNKKLKPETTQRREFDRDKDLNVPRMNNKMKNSFIKDASSTFTNRFSGGKFEKFL